LHIAFESGRAQRNLAPVVDHVRVCACVQQQMRQGREAVVGGQYQQAIALLIAQLERQASGPHRRQRNDNTAAHPLEHLLQKFQRVGVKQRRSQGIAHQAQSCKQSHGDRLSPTCPAAALTLACQPSRRDDGCGKAKAQVPTKLEPFDKKFLRL